jgi:hypothetical protein
MFIRSKKLENNLLNSERMEGNSKIIKKQKKKLQNDENSDKEKNFFFLGHLISQMENKISTFPPIYQKKIEKGP